MELGKQRAAVLLERTEILGRIIGLTISPASKVDADQLEGQSATGQVVFVSVASFLLLVIALSPRFLVESTSRVFVEALAAKLRATVAHADGF